MKPIGPVLKKLRLIQKLTLKDVATKMDITTSELSFIEHTAKIKKETIKKVCKAMDISDMLVAFYVIEPKDVAKDKRDIFKDLNPLIKNLIEDTLKK